MKVKQVWRALMNKLPKNVSYKWIIAISATLICAGALTAFYIQPKLVQIIVKFLFVAKPGHYVRRRHEMKQRFKYKLFLWNVTNPNEITAGTERPKMQEVGPYVFTQLKQKLNSEDNQTEDTVSFNFLSTFIFSPQLSWPLTGNEVVTLTNTAIVSPIVKIHLESPHLLKILIEAMDTIFDNPSSIFVTMTAVDFIDNGIEIDCNHTIYAAKLVCGEMRRRKTLKVMNAEKTLLRYRWFDNLNNSMHGHGRYTIKRGSKNIRDVGQVVAVNEQSKLKIYKEDEKCNVINGTDMMYFPPFQRQDEILWVFSDYACKSFPLRFKHKEMVRGVKTAYKNMFLSDPLMNLACECNRFSGCAVSGTVDLHHCLDIFVSISAPHFYLAESSLRDSLEGMHPRENLHETGCYIDLQTGLPINANERVQVNFLLKRIPDYHIFSNIAGDTWLPLLWYEESFSIEKSDLIVIHLSKISQVLGLASGYILMVVGVGGLTMTSALISYQYFRGQVLVEPIDIVIPEVVEPEVNTEEFLEQSSDQQK